MKNNLIIALVALLTIVAVFAQKQDADRHGTFQKKQNMDISKLTNKAVKAAFEAWQSGDSKTFLSFFISNPEMTDDGNHRNFQGFVKEACGKEVFLSIDKVENDGRDIFGMFKAGQWGTFQVFFKFHQSAEGKFDRLDIGQAKY